MIGFVRLCAFAALALAAPAEAQAVELQHLGGDVSVLIGTSCNVLILPSEGGTLIVDDQRGSNFAETMAGIRSLTSSPVRYVVNTHWHLDHSGGNGAFVAAGAKIVAQRNVRTRRATEQYMVAYKRRIPADPPAALPAALFDERKVLRIGSETVELRHVANAHTDGDTLVRFRKGNVIAMGDVFFNHIFPFIDRSSGGTIRGMIGGIQTALAMSNKETKFVPAHGPVASGDELRAYRDMLRNVMHRVRSDMRAGRTLEQVVKSHPAAAYREGMEGDEDRFVEAVYDSLKDENLHHRL